MGGRSRSSESLKTNEPLDKKKGFADWMNLMKPGNEEKDHWVISLVEKKNVHIVLFPFSHLSFVGRVATVISGMNSLFFFSFLNNSNCLSNLVFYIS